MIEPDAMAPDFTLADQDGNAITLSSFRGGRVLVAFYPKDMTPGCTKELCSLRDGFEALEGLGLTVLAISMDGQASHKRFADKHGFPFHLLSDQDHSVMESYGAWGEKNMYGKKVTGVIRSSFLVDKNGRIMKVWKKVSTATHGEDVKTYLEGLEG